jgi:hypothetical protein
VVGLVCERLGWMYEGYEVVLKVKLIYGRAMVSDEDDDTGF